MIYIRGYTTLISRVLDTRSEGRLEINKLWLVEMNCTTLMLGRQGAEGTPLLKTAQ